MQLLVGANYNPENPNTTRVQEITQWHADHPDSRLYRFYFATDNLSWNHPEILAIPNHVKIFLTFKNSADIANFESFVAAYPAARLAEAGWFGVDYHHEPDSWKSPTDTQGDPDPATWRTRLAQLMDVWAGMSAEMQARVKIGATFTEWRARNDSAVWEQNWGVVLGWTGTRKLHWLGLDVHNISGSTYRDAEQKYGWGYNRAAQAGLPVFWAENGEPRKDDPPGTNELNTGAERCERLWSFYLYNKGRTDCVGWSWYCKDNNNLYLTPPEHQVMMEIQADALIDPFTPDPNHPQYQAGYAAGLEDGEATGFENGKAIGRAEGEVIGKRTAYTDIRDYAQSKIPA